MTRVDGEELEDSGDLGRREECDGATGRLAVYLAPDLADGRSEGRSFQPAAHLGFGGHLWLLVAS